MILALNVFRPGKSAARALFLVTAQSPVVTLVCVATTGDFGRTAAGAVGGSTLRVSRFDSCDLLPFKRSGPRAAAGAVGANMTLKVVGSSGSSGLLCISISIRALVQAVAEVAEVARTIARFSTVAVVVVVAVAVAVAVVVVVVVAMLSAIIAVTTDAVDTRAVTGSVGSMRVFFAVGGLLLVVPTLSVSAFASGSVAGTSSIRGRDCDCERECECECERERE